MRTIGGFVLVYPVPALSIVIEEIVPPALITGFPNAVVSPRWGTRWEVDPIVTVAVLYPTPPSERTIDEIVPVPLTTAVPAAPDVTICDANLNLFWKVKEVSFSFLALNSGLNLST